MDTGFWYGVEGNGEVKYHIYLPVVMRSAGP
jgi:hypothetical protein